MPSSRRVASQIQKLWCTASSQTMSTPTDTAKNPRNSCIEMKNSSGIYQEDSAGMPLSPRAPWQWQWQQRQQQRQHQQRRRRQQQQRQQQRQPGQNVAQDFLHPPAGAPCGQAPPQPGLGQLRHWRHSQQRAQPAQGQRQGSLACGRGGARPRPRPSPEGATARRRPTSRVVSRADTRRPVTYREERSRRQLQSFLAGVEHLDENAGWHSTQE